MNTLPNTLEVGFVLVALNIIGNISRNFTTRDWSKKLHSRILNGERVRSAVTFITNIHKDEPDLGFVLVSEYQARETNSYREAKSRHDDFIAFINDNNK